MPKKPSPLSQPPAALGYRMPAEWEPHDATWLAWPHNRSDWPGKFDGVPWIYAEIIRHLARLERVNILVDDEPSEAKARAVLVRAHVLPEKASAPGKPAGNLRFLRIPTDRVWTRDYGPIFVRRDSRKGDFPAVAATAWRFNAWAKYDDWKLDAPVAAEIAKRLRLPAWLPEVRIDGELHHIVLEGGSIDVNGRGTLITTEECLLRELRERDPEAYGKIDKQNPRRVIRAVEVIRLTGKKFSEQRAEWKSKVQGPKSEVFFCLNRQPADLHARINLRVDEMFRRGLVEETRGLLQRGLAENQTAMQAIGYRQVVEHLRGGRSLAETIGLVKIRTRQFARRQLTWFRRQLDPEWMELKPDGPPEDAARKIRESAIRWQRT